MLLQKHEIEKSLCIKNFFQNFNDVQSKMHQRKSFQALKEKLFS